MKKLIALALMLAAPAWAQLDIRHFYLTNDVSVTRPAVRDMKWYGGESVIYDLTILRGAAAVDLSTPTNLVVRWEAFRAGTTNPAYIMQTGTIVNAAGGAVRVTLTSAQANCPTGDYDGHLRLYQAVSGTNTYVGTADRRNVQVLLGPSAAGTAYVGPYTNTASETDPVFLSSPAATITASNIAAWGATAGGDITAVNIVAGTGLTGTVLTATGVHTQTLALSAQSQASLALADTALQASATQNLATVTQVNNATNTLQGNINAKVSTNDARYLAALTNTPTLQQVVNASTVAPVTNAPYLVQTNATDVTFAGWRFLNAGGSFMQNAGPSEYSYILDKNGRNVLGSSSTERYLMNAVGDYIARWDTEFEVGPATNNGLGVKVYTTLTNHTAQIAARVATNDPAYLAAVTGSMCIATSPCYVSNRVVYIPTNYDASGAATSATNGINAAFIASKGGVTNGQVLPFAQYPLALTNAMQFSIFTSTNTTTVFTNNVFTPIIWSSDDTSDDIILVATPGSTWTMPKGAGVISFLAGATTLGNPLLSVNLYRNGSSYGTAARYYNGDCIIAGSYAFYNNSATNVWALYYRSSPSTVTQNFNQVMNIMSSPDR